MAINIPAVFLLGSAVYVLCRYAGLRPWQAAVSILFGFFLASTGIAPYISQATDTLIKLLHP